jgi:tetratricopeptide (TPR) repeat protein
MEYPSSTWDGKQRIQAECHTRIGLAYWRMRMFHVAVTHFSKALELCHDDGILWLFRALARIPVELPEKVSFKFHDVFMALELISKSGEWRHAKEIVMIAARMNPHDAMAFYIRGRIHLKTHVLEEAAKDLTVPILRGLDASGRDYAFLHYERGMAYAFAGDYDKAIHDYTQSLRLDPTHANALAGRAACYTEIKCYDKALADWTLHVDLTNSAAVVAEMG